ncbi:MAG TPA: hypothetical protein VEC36_11575 [Patescibacteria group bacterium]|nr:hypothetical protein [Patescibacteria group bacterium]
MKNFVIALLLLLAFAGCERLIEPSDENAADYLPITPGSTWEYFYNGDYAYGMELVAGNDTIINGKVFKTQHAEGWSEAVNIYRFKGDDIYKVDRKTDEELIFKMAPVGTSWSSRIQYDSVNFSIVKSSVISKGQTMEVYGNTFNDVIHIRSLVENYFANGSSGDYVRNRYFAKGVGIIKEQVEDGNPGFNGLKNYSIK